VSNWIILHISYWQSHWSQIWQNVISDVGLQAPYMSYRDFPWQLFLETVTTGFIMMAKWSKMLLKWKSMQTHQSSVKWSHSYKTIVYNAVVLGYNIQYNIRNASTIKAIIMYFCNLVGNNLIVYKGCWYKQFIFSDVWPWKRSNFQNMILIRLFYW
jgi:hypothetical protein